jgi:hypothetical protein
MNFAEVEKLARFYALVILSALSARRTYAVGRCPLRWTGGICSVAGTRHRTVEFAAGGGFGLRPVRHDADKSTQVLRVMAPGGSAARGAQDDKSGNGSSVTNDLYGGGKLGMGFRLSARMHCRAFMICHPERVLCAKDLCSWAVSLRWRSASFCCGNATSRCRACSGRRLWWGGGW